MTQRGVDIADEDGNGTPAWEVAKGAGLRFAIFRACEGTTIDTMFQTYWKQALAHGVKRGAYLLLTFHKEGPTPEEQVDCLLVQTGMPLPTDLPATIDLEFPHGRKATGFTASEALAWFLRSRTHYRARTGFEAMTYTSYVVWVDPDGMNNLPCPGLDDTPTWIKYWPWAVHTIAHTSSLELDALRDPPIPPPMGTTWMIEQTQGDSIKNPGFVGLTDCDRFNVLQYGSHGGFVKYTQRRVGVAPDGIYGTATRAAVTAFQQKHGLTADGIVGLDTFSYLAQTQPIT